MKWLLAAPLALALAGCADCGNVEEKPIKLVAPTEQILPPTNPVRAKLIPAKAEASKPDANEGAKTSSLMECVSDACKVQCSPGTEKQSRPKWCLYFKEPNDRHALSAPSDIQRKSTE